ncbi:MAG: 4Fe-4S dicluster domain-containing protein [Rhodospirillales bacterium]|jgi:molybdopterin-containing oxidoreductase family iron-sulfur binding subunit|nr:4Fe-4S dicluster domain-containing protein [Rhodospirillales bacterium]
MTKRAAPVVDPLRRRLLAGTAAAAALTLAPGVLLMAAPAARAKAAGEAVSEKVRWGLLIDTNRLPQAACDAMVAACNAENSLRPGSRPEVGTQWIRRVDIKDKQTNAAKSLPVMCQHCEFPPCADVCPTGASFRRADGIVLVDKHICIGCRYCMLACPYKARSFGYEDIADQQPHSPRGKGTVSACTLCVHRIDEGRLPACVEAAEKVAPGAVLFGDLKDPESAISRQVSKLTVTRIRADLGVEPGVLYSGL